MAIGQWSTVIFVPIVKRLQDFLFVRHRHNWLMLIRFGLVGGSGVLVNLFIVFLCNKIGPHPEEIVAPIPLTEFSVRLYHVYSTLAFLIANLSNFQLNRIWTFRSGKHAKWWAEFGPFLAVGATAQVIGLGVQTLLMNPTSPIALDRTIFDESTGLRTPYYWAALISIMVTVPLSFLINKLWTFRAVRGTGTDPVTQGAGPDEAPAEPAGEIGR